MTPNEIYKLPVESVETDLSGLIGCYYNHVKESGVEAFVEGAEGVEVRVIKHFNFDFRRYWRLATVWFEDKPVMVIQNAGREGDDFSRRVITDQAAFRDLCKYVASLAGVDEPEETEVLAPDADLDQWDEFYGNSLNGHFKRNQY